MKEKFSYEAPFLFELTELPVNGAGEGEVITVPGVPQDDEPGEVEGF